MASFDGERGKFSRRVNQCVELELDRCANVCGRAPCKAVDLGDGSRCGYTWATCQSKLDYVRTTRVRRFTLTDLPAVDVAAAPADLLGGTGALDAWPQGGYEAFGGPCAVAGADGRPGSFGASRCLLGPAAGTQAGIVGPPVSGLAPGSWTTVGGWFMSEAACSGTVSVTNVSRGLSAAPDGTAWASGAVHLAFALPAMEWVRVGSAFEASEAFASGDVYRATWSFSGLPVGTVAALDDLELRGPVDRGTSSLPYVAKVADVAQRIDVFGGQTEARKVTVDLNLDFSPFPDDADKPVFNSARPNEYWAALVARNPNYNGRPMRIKAGFAGVPYADWRVVADMTIASFKGNATSAQVTGTDVVAILNTAKLPYSVSDDNKIVGDPVSGLRASTETVKVVSNGQIPDPADFPNAPIVVEIGDADGFRDDSNPTRHREYAVVLAVSGAGDGNEYLRLSRGRYGTTAVDMPPASGVANFAWRHVYIAGEEGSESAPGAEDWSRNAVDVARDLVRLAGVPDDLVDDSTFVGQRNNFYPSLRFSRTVVEPKQVSDLLKEIRTILCAAVYVDRDCKLAFRVLGPPTAAEELNDFDDGRHVVDGSFSYDDDQSQRITEASVWFAPVKEDAGENPQDYSENVTLVDGELIDPCFYGDRRPFYLFSNWFRKGESLATIKDLLARRISLLKNGLRTVKFRLEAKDDVVDVGSYCYLTVRQVAGIDGTPARRLYFVTGVKTVDVNVREYEAIAADSLASRFMFIGPADMAGSYASAPDADRRIGYFGDADGRLDDASGKVAGYQF